MDAASRENMKTLPLLPEFKLSDEEFICDNEKGECIITRKAFNRLPEYSLTFPTGVVPGKRWKCNANLRIKGEPFWIIRGYDLDPKDANYCLRRKWTILEII